MSDHWQTSAQGGMNSDTAKMMAYDANKKSLLLAYLLLIFVGIFGIHRFYLGRFGSAITILILGLPGVLLFGFGIGLITLAIVVIWTFVDLFLLPGIVTRYNNNLVMRLTGRRPL